MKNGADMTGDNTARTKIIQEYGYCSHCGRKGLYQLHGKYCRCRYCGLYRILLRESDFQEKLVLAAPESKRGD
jgi:DNA-directed RNA polymerase subunit RPC12/RpoP